MFETPIVSGSTIAGPDALPQSFSCSWEQGCTDVACIYVSGEVDLATLHELRQTVMEAQLQARLVVLDLRELTFMGSCGVHVLLDATDAARQVQGRMILVRGPTQIDRLLTLCGVSDQLEIIDLGSGEPTGRALLRPVGNKKEIA